MSLKRVQQTHLHPSVSSKSAKHPYWERSLMNLIKNVEELMKNSEERYDGLYTFLSAGREIPKLWKTLHPIRDNPSDAPVRNAFIYMYIAHGVSTLTRDQSIFKESINSTYLPNESSILHQVYFSFQWHLF